MKHLIWIFILAHTWGWSSPLILTNSQKVLSLDQNGWYLEDPENSLSFRDLDTLDFTPLSASASLFDRSIPAYWLKFEISNPAKEDQTFFLSITSSTEYCQLFVQKDNSVTFETYGGSLVPVADRPYQDHLLDPYIPVVFPPGKSVLFVHLESHSILSKSHRDIHHLSLIGSRTFKQIHTCRFKENGIG